MSHFLLTEFLRLCLYNIGIMMKSNKLHWRWRDSNPLPFGLKPDALSLRYKADFLRWLNIHIKINPNCPTGFYKNPNYKSQFHDQEKSKNDFWGRIHEALAISIIWHTDFNFKTIHFPLKIDVCSNDASVIRKKMIWIFKFCKTHGYSNRSGHLTVNFQLIKSKNEFFK